MSKSKVLVWRPLRLISVSTLFSMILCVTYKHDFVYELCLNLESGATCFWDRCHMCMAHAHVGYVCRACVFLRDFKNEGLIMIIGLLWRILIFALLGLEVRKLDRISMFMLWNGKTYMLQGIMCYVLMINHVIWKILLQI